MTTKPVHCSALVVGTAARFAGAVKTAPAWPENRPCEAWQFQWQRWSLLRRNATATAARRSESKQRTGSTVALDGVTRYIDVAASAQNGFHQAADFPSCGLFLGVAARARAGSCDSRQLHRATFFTGLGFLFGNFRWNRTASSGLSRNKLACLLQQHHTPAVVNERFELAGLDEHVGAGARDRIEDGAKLTSVQASGSSVAEFGASSAPPLQAMPKIYTREPSNPSPQNSVNLSEVAISAGRASVSLGSTTSGERFPYL